MTTEIVDGLMIAEAATLVDVHENTLRARVKAGRYPSQTIVTEKGMAYLIPRAALEAEVRGEPLPPKGTYRPGAGFNALDLAGGPAALGHRAGDPTVIDQNGRELIAAPPQAAAYDALVLSLREALDPTITELARAADALHDAAQELAVTRAALDRAQADLDAERARRAAIPQDAADPWRQVLHALGTTALSLTERLTPRQRTHRPSPR